jgi:acyl-CoA thioesterase-1
LGFINRSLIGLLLLCFTLTAWSADDPSSADSPGILVLGDSLSAGYGMDIDQGWVSLLREKLEGRYPHKVVNASVSGEISRGGLNRLPRLLEEHRPEVVILELGGNDGLRGQPLTKLRDNLSEMIEQSQNAGARVLLIGIQIPPNYGKRYSEQFTQLYPQLAERAPGPAQLGVGLILLPALFFALLITCAIPAELLGFPSPRELIPAFATVTMAVFLLSAAGIAIFGLVALRSRTLSRHVGSSLLVFAISWVVLLGGSYWSGFPIPDHVTVAVGAMQTVALLGIGYGLRAASGATDHPDPVPDATA